MESRLTDLEVRMTHQEAALDALTAASLAQERALEALRAELALLKSMLRDLAPAATDPGAEPPPPHY